MENLVKIVFLSFLFSTFGFSQNEWLEPTQDICENNGGKKESKYHPCSSSWKNANKICEAMNTKLPTIKELEEVINQCNGKIDDQESNSLNKEYQICYKNKGFEGSFFYWSSTKAPEQLGFLGIQFEQGFNGFANPFYNLHVKCKSISK